MVKVVYVFAGEMDCLWELGRVGADPLSRFPWVITYPRTPAILPNNNRSSRCLDYDNDEASLSSVSY